MIDIKLEDRLVKKVVEVAKKVKPYKSYNTYAKAIRDALDFFIEENSKEESKDSKPNPIGKIETIPEEIL